MESVSRSSVLARSSAKASLWTSYACIPGASSSCHLMRNASARGFDLLDALADVLGGPAAAALWMSYTCIPAASASSRPTQDARAIGEGHGDRRVLSRVCHHRRLSTLPLVLDGGGWAALRLPEEDRDATGRSLVCYPWQRFRSAR